MSAGASFLLTSAIIWGSYLWVTYKTRRTNYRAVEPNVEVSTGGRIFMTLHNATPARATTAALTAISCGARMKQVSS